VWKRAAKNEYELPNADLDELIFSIKVFQGEMLSVYVEG
jgi:hypothetical protein